MKPDYSIIILGGGYTARPPPSLSHAPAYGSHVLVVDRRGRAGYPPTSTSGIASYWLDKLGSTGTGRDCVPDRSFRLVVSGNPPGTERMPGDPLARELGVVLQEKEFLGRLETESTKAGVTFRHLTHAENAVRHGDWSSNLRMDGRQTTVTSSWILNTGGYDSRISKQSVRYHQGVAARGPPRRGLEVSVPNIGQHPPTA